jgi:hypothetical protein
MSKDRTLYEIIQELNYAVVTHFRIKKETRASQIGCKRCSAVMHACQPVHDVERGTSDDAGKRAVQLSYCSEFPWKKPQQSPRTQLVYNMSPSFSE